MKSELLNRKWVALVFPLLLAFQLLAAETAPATSPAKTPLGPGPNDYKTAQLASRVLERYHYLQKPVNEEMSSKFYDHYLTALDGQRIYFRQPDLKEFEFYRNKLGEMTIQNGDTTPAYKMFNRLLLHLQEQYDFVQQALKTEKFEFNADERFVFNRKDAPWPKDEADAKKLWHDRLRYEYLQEKLNKKKPDEIVKIITGRYTRVYKMISKYDNEEVLRIYLSALTHAYDPHSDYYNKAEMDNFAIGMKLSLFGIGAVLTSEDGYCTVKELMPGGPADRSKKLNPKDRIIKVAQADQEPVEVVDEKLSKIVDLIRGPKGTEVRLTVIPADADSSVRKVVTLIRDEIKLEDQEAKAQIIEAPDAEGKIIRLGVIDLPSFYADFDSDNSKPASERKSTTTDVAKLLRKLMAEKVGGVILDLRRNGGGSLDEAINLTGIFIKEGPVVQVKDPDGKVTVDSDTDPTVLYQGPLIVLTSRFSASASEILAGALQDYDRALIVGDSSTHGKGTVQTIVRLAKYLRQPLNDDTPAFDPGGLKVTIRKFYLPDGSSTQLRGVKPQIVLPSVNNDLEVGEISLENPLPWDTIEGAKFDRVNAVKDTVAELKKRSDNRIAKDKDFAYVREDIERYKKMREDKTISLNEAQRLKEKKENTDRISSRNKERLARNEPPPKNYKLTLKDAGLPGLPAPVANTNLTQTASVKKTNPPASTDDDEEPDPADNTKDVTLKETERILIDLINLTPKKPVIAENK